jgi:pseudaminic acid synthase
MESAASYRERASADPMTKQPNGFTIAGRRIYADEPPYLIAEMSGNHNGDISRAFAIMEAAAAARADALKLQTYTADTLTIDCSKPDFVIKGGLWDGRTLHELYRQAHTPWEWHEALFQKGRDLGIAVFSTPFDDTAVDYLEKLGAPAYKIASFEALHLPLLRRVAATGKPVLLSTGMCDLADIEEAVGTLRAAGCRDLLLFHCVSGYPTPAHEANLRTIRHLAETFGVPIGLSDHTLDNAVAVAAVATGAVAIEKHFTLRRSDGGPDAAFSLEPSELSDLAGALRTAWSALGRADYALAPSEHASAVFRRSVYAVRDIAAGEMITAENIRIIRPGYGLPPRDFDKLIGRRARSRIERGTSMAWDLVE